MLPKMPMMMVKNIIVIFHFGLARLKAILKDHSLSLLPVSIRTTDDEN